MGAVGADPVVGALEGQNKKGPLSLGCLRSAGISVPVRVRSEPLSARVVDEEKREGFLWARTGSEPPRTLFFRGHIVEFLDFKWGQ